MPQLTMIMFSQVGNRYNIRCYIAREGHDYFQINNISDAYPKSYMNCLVNSSSSSRMMFVDMRVHTQKVCVDLRSARGSHTYDRKCVTVRTTDSKGDSKTSTWK